MDNYIEKNRNAWNQKAIHHFDSDFYDVASFIAGKTSLNEIELSILGDVSGKRILHLQCHFGQDSIALSRMGAKVTGVDFSEKAIALANDLAIKCNSDATFICCDVYHLPKVLHEQFDMVFTSYGTVGWLPDINQWGHVISHFLKPGARFIMADFHPVLWMFDNHFRFIQYPYFNIEAIVEQEDGTYADTNAPIRNETISWNHSLSSILNSLLKNGISIISIEEFDYSPYNCFQELQEIAPKKFRVKHLDNKIPMVYLIEAAKK
jgi:SAM-dependent methyltransferase